MFLEGKIFTRKKALFFRGSKEKDSFNFIYAAFIPDASIGVFRRKYITFRGIHNCKAVRRIHFVQIILILFFIRSSCVFSFYGHIAACRQISDRNGDRRISGFFCRNFSTAVNRCNISIAGCPFQRANKSGYRVYKALDTGRAIKGKRIDVYLGDSPSAHKLSLGMGLRNYPVVVLN